MVLVGFLTLAGGVDAHTGTSGGTVARAEGGGQLGRFEMMANQQVTRLSGATPPDDPDAIVSATVVLTGDSVLSARARSIRTNRVFDAAATERTVAAAQARTVPGLRAAGATVRAQITNVLNAVTVDVRVRDLPQLRAVPGVSQVHLSRLIQRDNGASNAFTGADDVWDSVGGYTGAGITIGIIDDGIDYYHADFGGSGNPADFSADDGLTISVSTFPTAKVIGGYDFVGDAYDPSSLPIDCGSLAPGDTDPYCPAPDPDPLACWVHGTHVAGTAAGAGVLTNGDTFAGPYDAATVGATSFEVAPGSAPEATIRMYKVFGCDGGASDTVVLAAIAQAVADGVDVLNMSLGSTWGTPDDPLAVALNNAAIAGVLPVVSAGNSGANPYLVGGPSTADRALSVAAVDTSIVPGVAITGGVTVTAQNSNEHDFVASGPISGDTFYVGFGCVASSYVGASGKIVVADRGATCARVDRATLADAAGALAVVFVNNEPGFPPMEGPIVGVSIPFVGVDEDDPAVPTLRASGVTLTLDGGPLVIPAYGRYASFTSNGPRSDNSPKPDVSAPGVNIRSADVGSGTGSLLLSGTSMAAPHTAGVAALVVQAHPGWTPAELKGALMNTAAPGAVLGLDVVRGGTGVIHAPSAVDTVATVTTSDGLNSLAFEFVELSGAYEGSRTFTLVNHSAGAITYDMAAAVDDLGLGAALAITFDSNSVTVPAATVSGPGTAEVTVTIAISDPTNLPSVQTELEGVLSSINGLVSATPTTVGPGVFTLSVPLLLVPYGASSVHAAAPTSIRTDGLVHVPDRLELTNAGAHEGFYDVYQWAITDSPTDAPAAETPDIREVGVQYCPAIDCGLDIVVFAISLADTYATMGVNYFEIQIDTGGTATPEFDLVAADNGLLTTGDPDGLLSAYLFPHNGGPSLSGFRAFAPYNGSTILLPALLTELGDGPYHFTVFGDSVVATVSSDTTGLGHFDPLNPAVNNALFDPFGLAPGETAVLPTTVDMVAVRTQGALGWLVVALDDASGATEADTVPILVSRPRRPA
ncbi:MAG: S8 family serine peptidase [Actinomycetota bacterium]|nr:S8 family serine peptidase [Actinomycetota bacterium]